MFKSFVSASLAAVAFAVNVEKIYHSADLELAEVIGGHTCLSTAKRGKEAVDDFWKILKGTAKYTDDDFTTDMSSLFWSDMGETGSLLDGDVKTTKWKRASSMTGYSLFGDGISIDDAAQG